MRMGMFSRTECLETSSGILLSHISWVEKKYCANAFLFRLLAARVPVRAQHRCFNEP